MSKPRILLIEDTASMSALYLTYLKDGGFDADIAEDGRTALEMMSKRPYHAVVLDLHLPDVTGMELLERITQHYDKTPVLVITAYGSIDKAVDAMRTGAFDFITKPFPAERLTTTVKKALEHTRMQKELQELRRDMFQENYQDNYIGAAPVMQAIFRQIDSVAPSRANIFITGENGTGKELTARAIHRASPRAPKPFIIMNCASLVGQRVNAELFGEKGEPGAVQLAHGGTLFLDDVCDLAPDLQTKLLSFLQTGRFTLADGGEKKADVRVICASSKDPRQEVDLGRLREDLFYRLNVIPLEMPPLRERENDAVLIARHFLQRFTLEEKKGFAGFDPDVLALFLQYDWPGNVRQLENLMHQVVAMNDGLLVTLSMLPQSMRDATPEAVPPAQSSFRPFLVKPLWQIEKDTILKALEASQNSIPRAAAMLEVPPSTIHRKMQEWNGSSDVMQQALNGVSEMTPAAS
jgi:two-component system repressor protein LuxO